MTCLCHKWSRICSSCRNHNSVLSSFITYYRVCNKSNTTWGSFCSIFCVIFCRSLFVLLSFFFLPFANNQMKGTNNDLQNTTQKTWLKSGWIQILRKGKQFLHICTVLSFSLLNTRLQELILSPVLSCLYNYVSPSNDGRHIVLVWFFLPLLLLLISEACPDHNFFEIGQWYLVCGCMTIKRCVAYRNGLRGILTFDLKVK